MLPTSSIIGRSGICLAAIAASVDRHRPANRATKSRVEWRFSSPTITVLPPYDCTTARSGTDSTV